MKPSQDPQWTPEQEVLLWAIRVDHASDEHVAGILRTGIDWGYLRENAVRHGIVPLLYKRMKGEMGSLAPPNELSAIRTLFLENSIRNLQMTRHLISVLDLLAGSGIEAMPFKGPALAVQAYRDPSMRSYGDLDILIHAEDRQRAFQVLMDHGHILTGPDQHSLEERLRYFQQKDLRLSYQNITLEVHWKIIEELYAVPLTMDQLWDRSLPVCILNRETKTPSPEDMLLVLCFHGFKHGGQRLTWLADVIHLISDHPDLILEDVIVRAETLGLKRIVLICLFLAYMYGGVRFGPEIEKRFISDERIQNIASNIQSDMFRNQRFGFRPLLYMTARERFKDKCTFLIYYSINQLLVFTKWIVRRFKGGGTSPDEEIE
ncbi:MAG TPA: nucleotidyltransferase family protein [Methanoregula sp.]|nr:nucleotidyltransferase family protein [Methanoregula sp.]